MAELKYRGAETLNYRQADFSELKYIKVLYTDADDMPHELTTEVNFLSDNYLSLYVKRVKEEPEEEKDKEEIEVWQNDREVTESSRSDFEEYLKKIAEIKAAKERAGISGNFHEYYKKLAELKQANIESRQSEQTEKSKENPAEKNNKEQESPEEQKEREEEEKKKYNVRCPQQIVLKFIIDELLYVAKAELKSVEIKSAKVFFNIKAPDVLKLKQRRKYYRIVLRRLCMLAATDKEGSTAAYVSRTINLSAGGVLINRLEPMTSSKYIRLDSSKYKTYNLAIVLEPEKVIKLEARFVREEEGKNSYRYAFEFINISPEKIDFLSKYVIRKQIEKLGLEFDVKFNAKNNQNIKKRRR